MPIQFLAACDPVSTEALLSDGSSGEYDASARKRRSAETHNKNPTSSFRRRFLVGEKIFEKIVMWQRRHRQGRIHPDSTVTRPELDNYAKKGTPEQCGKRPALASWVRVKGIDLLNTLPDIRLEQTRYLIIGSVSV